MFVWRRVRYSTAHASRSFWNSLCSKRALDSDTSISVGPCPRKLANRMKRTEKKIDVEMYAADTSLALRHLKVATLFPLSDSVNNKLFSVTC